MIRVTHNLSYGDLEDCFEAPTGWAVVHAAKHPCFAQRCGQPKPSEANYLSQREGDNLYLNMVDPERPLFRREMFDQFLSFAREMRQQGKPLLIHCNQGESRSPSLAILFLAKVAQQLPDNYQQAVIEFQKMSGRTYRPSGGIKQWLNDRWHEIQVDSEEV